MHSWRLRLCLVARVRALCDGFGLEREAWEYVEYLADVAIANPLPRDAKESLFGLLRELEHGGGLARAAEACPRDVLTLLAQSLTVVEATQGEKAMLTTLQQALDLRHHAGPAASSQLDWAAGLLHLVRGDGDASTCKLPGAPRVYVYETGKLSERPLACSAGMEGVEVFYHRFFTTSACRTYLPEEADLFYVPFYSFCYQNEHLAPGNETAELDALNLGLVSSLAHYSGDAKSRHLFLFPHEFWDFPSWRGAVASAQLLVVEANPLEWEAPADGTPSQVPRHCLTCFSGHKDVVLPGHTDHWTTRQLVALQRPWKEREHRVCYHGAFAHALYDDTSAAPPFDTTAGMTRAALAALGQARRPGVSIGGHLRPVRAYYERITNCQFCFVPKGVGFTNGRLMESFFSGCVPVILSDAMVVPFDQFLPWPSFSLKFPMPRSLKEAHAIVDHLESLPPDMGLRMHEALGEHRCWFDYGPDSRAACSPYEGVLRVLTWQARSREPRRFWNVG